MIRAIFLVFLIEGLLFGPQTSYSRMYEHEGGRYKEGLTYLVKLNLRDAWDESTVVLDDIQYKLKAAMDASDSHFGAMTHKAERIVQEHDALASGLNSTNIEDSKTNLTESVQKYCEKITDSCTDEKGRRDDVKDWAKKLDLSTVLDEIRKNITDYKHKKEGMDKTIGILKAEIETASKTLKHLVDAATNQKHISKIINENAISFDQVLKSIENADIRKLVLQTDIEQTIQEIQKSADAASSFLKKLESGLGLSRRRRSSESHTEWDCKGNWKDFCNKNAVEIPTKDFNDTFRTVFEEFQSLYASFSDDSNSYIDIFSNFSHASNLYDTILCNYTEKIMWLEMLKFDNTDKPNLNISSVKFDPSKYSIDSKTKNLLYRNVEVKIEGLKYVDSLTIPAVNVHRYGEIDAVIGEHIRKELEKAACGDESFELLKMVVKESDACPELCKK